MPRCKRSDRIVSHIMLWPLWVKIFATVFARFKFVLKFSAFVGVQRTQWYQSNYGAEEKEISHRYNIPQGQHKNLWQIYCFSIFFYIIFLISMN